MPKDGPGSDLSALQRKACEEFIKDLRPSLAMKRAGYADSSANKNAYQFFDKDHVQVYIQYLQNKAGKRAGVTAEEIIRRLNKISERAERDNELPSAIRALELMGKHIAMFSDRQIIADEKNPWSTGDTPEAIAKDIKRLKKVSAPKLATVDGEEIDELETDQEADKAENG